MAEISKVKRSTGRRSSILKRALADIDVNVKDKTEVLTKSKRVSFADTYYVKEFPRDSPQILKATERNEPDADTSADTSLKDTSLTSEIIHPPNHHVEEPLLDNPAGSNFILDDGESTFSSGAIGRGRFYESTRAFDNVDNCMFGEAGGPDVSEITPGENSVFVSGPPAQTVGPSGVSTVSMLHTANFQPAVSRNVSKTTDRGHYQSFHTAAPRQMPLTMRQQSLDCQREANETIIFGDQDDGTMDLTLMDSTKADISYHPAPKISARDFLSKLKSGGSGQVFGIHQVREEKTIMFSDTGAMELTENLPQHDATDFQFAPQPFRPLPRSNSAESVNQDKTVLFGQTCASDDMNLTRNVSDTERPKRSAKAFLATLKGYKTSNSLASTALAASGDMKQDIQGEQREEADMTMELTCQDTERPKRSAKAFLAMLKGYKTSNSLAATAFAASGNMKQDTHLSTPDIEGEQREGGDMTMEMTCQDLQTASKNQPHNEMTGTEFVQQPGGQMLPTVNRKEDMAMEMTCMDFVDKPVVQTHPSTSKTQRDMTMTMDMTCIDPVDKPVIQTYSFSNKKEKEMTMTMEMTCMDPVVKPIQTHPSVSKKDMTMTMEMTCMDPVVKPIQTHPSFSKKEKDMTMTMEMTCMDPVAKPIQTHPSFSKKEKDMTMTMEMTCMDPVIKPIQTRPSFSKKDMTMTMEMTCMDPIDKPVLQMFPPSHKKEKDLTMKMTHVNPVSKPSMQTHSAVCSKEGDNTMEITCTEPVGHPIIQMSVSSTSQVMPSLPGAQASQQGTHDVLQTEDVTQTMELTGCVDSTHQLSSANLSATSIRTLAEGRSDRSRNALVDITARHISSSAAQPAVEVEEICRSAVLPVERGWTAAASPFEHSNRPSPTTTTVKAVDEGNSAALSTDKESEHTQNNLEKVDLLTTKDAVRPVQTDSRVSSAFSGSTSLLLNVSAGRQEEKPCSTGNQTVLFDAEQAGHDMDMTDVFLKPVDDQFNSPKSCAYEKKDDAAADVSFQSVAKSEEHAKPCQVLTVLHDGKLVDETVRKQSDVDGKAETVTFQDGAVMCETSQDAGGFIQEEDNLMKNTEEESDDVFNIRNPTTLVDITGVLANIKKKLDKQMPSQEKEVESSTDPEDVAVHNLSSADHQAKSDVVVGSSRKLQLSPTTQTKRASLLYMQIEKNQDNTLPSSSHKRQHQSFDISDNEPKHKSLRLSEQGVPECHSESMTVSSKNKKTELLPAQHLRRSSSSNSNGGNKTMSSDIFGETMPVILSASSNMSGVAGSTSIMSTSVTNDIKGSFLSFGRSFLDKQDSYEQPGSFVQTCGQLGITQSELGGWVCRRSSGAFSPDVACDTMEDQLNLASTVTRECESKAGFVSSMAAILQREKASTEQVETSSMKEITKCNLVAEVDQCPAMKQQIRSLLSASRKGAQIIWKTHKADTLHSLSQDMEAHQQRVCQDLADMTARVETMATLKQNINHSISRMQRQLESLQSQVSSRKKSTKHDHKQELQQQCTELASLREQVSKAKSSISRLQQKEADLQEERKRSRQHCDANADRQKQLMKAHDTLSTLHSLHCWRPVHVEDRRMEFLLLYDAVLLTVTLDGSSSVPQPITNITVSSRLKEGSEPWAVLATELTMDILTASRERLVQTYTTRHQMPQLLDAVTQRVEEVKHLCQQIKMACLKYHITIEGKQITVKLWSTELLRKVSLTTDIPVSSYPYHSFTWQTRVIMGNISETQVQKTIEQVDADRENLTNVVQAVQALLKG